MVVGSSTLGLIRIIGKVENKEAVVLIDYGATHNFISHQVVHKLDCQFRKTTNFGVVMGTKTAALK